MNDLNGSQPCFELNDAVVRRAGKDILRVDTLRIDEGESIAILGPNGAGKSTLIGLITREVFPLHRDEPPVKFRGNSRPTLEQVRSCLGIVSATMQRQITVHLPALEVVIGGYFGALGIPQRRVVSDDMRRGAYVVMEELGIQSLAERDIMTLSSGQARRVLIARALVHNPAMLVFDEPCTGLDPQGMYYMRKTMRDVVRRGCSVMLVTHYPEDIIPEIQRVILIKDGVIFADGSKDELLANKPMSDLFDVPLEVVKTGAYFALASRY